MDNKTIETSANYTGLYDDNNKPIIDKSYYSNVIQDRFKYYLEILNYNPDKLSANHLNAIFRRIQKDIFSINANQGHNEKCNIPYTDTNISILFDIYNTICSDFVCMPSIHGFSILTGIDDDKIKEVTSITSENLKDRREFIRNKLADNNLGVTVLANNDTSVGLLYTRQNAIESQAIKTGLSLSDLKPITDKTAQT